MTLNHITINQLEKCKLCISLGDSDLTSLLEQINKARQWADLIEIRLDKLRDLDPNMIAIIKDSAACPIIWTLRKASHGGDFLGTDEERFDIICSLFLARVTAYQPDYIDLEADTPQIIFQNLRDLFPKTEWIVSWHDFSETPKNLEILYQTISSLPASYYKIATFAQSTTDAIRMVKFTQKVNEKTSRLCGICMGEYGQPSRILSPLGRQPFTFASVEKGKEIAPGQLTAEELITVYRFHEINKETELLGLIGRPVDKSFSHMTHNAVLKALSLNAIYLKFHLNDEEFFSFFDEISSLPFRGLSVTMPFKERVLDLLQNTHHLPACNTLVRELTVRELTGWRGYNTDGIGALKALGFSSLKNQKMVILGAGGTAKAIACAAHQEGVDLVILNRTVERAKDIAVPIKAKWGPLDDLPLLTQEGYNCIVQATSVGMAPALNEAVVPSNWISHTATVLDVISNPAETRLLQEIKNKGGRAISGRELFIYQAVEQFVYWFGSNIPKEKVEQVIRNHLPSLTSASSLKQNHSFQVKKSSLIGSLSLPPSKSHTIRAILLAAFAEGISHVHNPLDSPDSACAIQAARHFGARVELTSTGYVIEGVAGNPITPSGVIDAGNSGQVLRFAGALGCLAEGYSVLTGDESIRSNRPIQPLLDGLHGLDTWAVSTRGNGYAPLIVKGPLKPGVTYLAGGDSQPVSALLMAAAFVEGKTEIHVQNPGEKPWLSLTLSWLDRLGVTYSHQNFDHFIIHGKKIRPAFEMTIPGDLSSLAFPLVAALVTKSEILIESVNLQDVQGDKILVEVLQRMGALLEIDPLHSSVRVLAEGKLIGQVIDVNDFIDAVPILAVIGCYAEGETELVNASIARTKECNRLASITEELKKMGASIEETADGLRIKQSPLQGACVSSHEDHRIAMSLIVAGLGAEGKTEVEGVDCIKKSYPTFIEDLKRMARM